MILRIVAFASWSLLRPILDRFWFDFGPPNRSKIGPKRAPKGVGNHWRSCMPSRTSKNRFFGQHGPNMTPTWPPRRPQIGAKIGQKSVQKRPRGPSRPRNWCWDDFFIDFGSILDRVWADVGSILEQCWIKFWVDIWPGVVSMLRWVPVHCGNDFVARSCHSKEGPPPLQLPIARSFVPNFCPES